MKRRQWLTFIALTCWASFAAAQSVQNLSTSEEVFRKRSEESFQAHDVDKDGYLVGEEIPGEIRHMLMLAKASPETRLNMRLFLEYREVAYQLQVASSFKGRDRNENGYLEKHEMPLALMKHLGKYTSADRVNFQEYMKFSLDRDFPVPPPPPQAASAKTMDMASPPIIVDSTELETPSIVYRAGKLPKGLPEWFEKLDTDMDGQVSLFEWRNARKPLSEFRKWDRNDDGLITFQEVLYTLKTDRALRPKTGP